MLHLWNPHVLRMFCSLGHGDRRCQSFSHINLGRFSEGITEASSASQRSLSRRLACLVIKCHQSMAFWVQLKICIFFTSRTVSESWNPWKIHNKPHGNMIDTTDYYSISIRNPSYSYSRALDLNVDTVGTGSSVRGSATGQKILNNRKTYLQMPLDMSNTIYFSWENMGTSSQMILKGYYCGDWLVKIQVPFTSQ